MWIVNDKVTDTHKLAWVVPILAFPLIGGLFYLIFGRQKVPDKKNIRFLKLKNELIINNRKEKPEYIDEQQRFVRIANFLERYSFNRFINTKTRYFGEAEEAFTEMLHALKTAQKYIFLEFFIVNFSYMWDEILEILKEKAATGVEVRLIYDDIGCIDRLPTKYFMELKKSGILCIVFNKASLFLNSYLNSRDHRKIIVIDGKIGFVRDRRCKVITGYGDLTEKTLWHRFVHHVKVQSKGITRIFYKTDHYEDSEDNLVKNS